MQIMTKRSDPTIAIHLIVQFLQLFGQVDHDLDRFDDRLFISRLWLIFYSISLHSFSSLITTVIVVYAGILYSVRK